jgi:ribosomal 50S subunit-recycling heat shock protein
LLLLSIQYRPRQIIVRLTNPIVKRRILKCRKNLKSYSKYKHVYINEDLTRTRNKIHLHARQLLKRKTIAQLWTTNGKILMKDKNNRIYETNTMDALAEVVQLLDPTYVWHGCDLYYHLVFRPCVISQGDAFVIILVKLVYNLQLIATQGFLSANYNMDLY